MKDLFRLIGGGIAAPVAIIVAGFLMYKMLNLLNIDYQPIVSVMVALTPLWLPFTLFMLTYEKWMYFVRLKFALAQGRSTLRIHLPQEVLKSPEAMEGVLTQIHNVNSADNLMQSWIDGKYPLVYSLELVSTGGEVHFYINVPARRTKDAVESQLYAYYPGVEVTEEVHDYTDEITWDPDKYEYMSFHMGKKAKTGSDDDVLPIKTYIDFGHDKIPKEEEKFEPMAAMLEQLSKIGPDERLWVQFLCVPHMKKEIKNGHLTEIPTWEAKAKRKIDEMLKRDIRENTDPDTYERAPMLTMGERDVIAAIERNVSKYAYEVGIRWMYITKKGKFNGDIISPTIRSFAQFDMIGRGAVGVKWRTDFDYNWLSDRSGKRKMAMKEREFFDHKHRAYNIDLKTKNDEMKVFSVEELATMYHLPGTSVMTPSLPRILSTRKEAPSNLPTGRAVGI
jgi:hypothetical protein